MFFFTICSNNYLAQAIVLGNSVKTFHPSFQFIIFLVDEKNEKVDYEKIGHEVVPIAEIEPKIFELAAKYEIIELNTSVKPRVIEYLFEARRAEKLIYLDPDVRVFAPFTEVLEYLDTCSVVLTPHIYSPIPMDGHTPQENLFLNYGIYNLGFIALSKTIDSQQLVNWWKQWTYHLGFDRAHSGIFVDQLPMNHAPLFFKNVVVLLHRGYNMAPWNLHERYLSENNSGIIVNGVDSLKFYHFSSFKLDSGELPVHNYTRFTMKQRPDLLKIHQLYNEELKAAGYDLYKTIPGAYSIYRQAHIEKLKKENWKKKSFLKKIGLVVLRSRMFQKLGTAITIHNSNY